MQKRLFKLITEYLSDTSSIAADATAFLIGAAIGLTPIFLNYFRSVFNEGNALGLNDIIYGLATSLLLGSTFFCFNGIRDKGGAGLLFLLLMEIIHGQSVLVQLRSFINWSDNLFALSAFIFFLGFRLFEIIRFGVATSSNNKQNVDNPDSIVSLNISSR